MKTHVKNEGAKQFFRNVALGAIILIVFLSLPEFCTGHTHMHSDENPAFKYTRQANELPEHEHEHHSDHHHKVVPKALDSDGNLIHFFFWFKFNN